MKGVRSDIVIPSALDSLEIDEEYLPYALPWSVVSAVQYTPITDLTPRIKELRLKSRTRMEEDPRYVARARQLKRLEEMQKTSTISLRLSDRLELARAERELMSLQSDEDESLRKKEKTDLVEEEALQVLMDMLS